MTDRDLAQLCAAAYTAAPAWAAADIHACRTCMPDADVVAFRGTVPDSIEDWCRDLDLVPAWGDRLGWCHAGFLGAARLVWPLLWASLGARPVVLTGHSLGGALAIITAGLLVIAGRPPAALVTFGTPRAGLGVLAGLLAGIAVRQYRHGDDPVPEVPFGYRHMRLPLIQVGSGGGDPIADHSIAGYVATLPP